MKEIVFELGGWKTPTKYIISGQIIATSHDRFPPKGSFLEGESPYFRKSRLVKYYNLARLYEHDRKSRRPRSLTASLPLKNDGTGRRSGFLLGFFGGELLNFQGVKFVFSSQADSFTPFIFLGGSPYDSLPYWQPHWLNGIAENKTRSNNNPSSQTVISKEHMPERRLQNKRWKRKVMCFYFFFVCV